MSDKDRTGGEVYLSRIKSRYDTFTPTQKHIADYLRDHAEEISGSSVTVLARKIGTSPSAITRFCQALNYKGFGEMRFCLEKEIFDPLFKPELDIANSDSIDSIKKKLAHMQANCVSNTVLQVSSTNIERAALSLCRAKTVHIYGDGGPGANASYIYQLFLQIGIPCSFFTDISLARLASVQLQRGDVAIGITYSGESKTILEAISFAKKRGATTVGITGYPDSALAKAVSISLCYSAKVEDDLRYLHVARMCELAIIGLLQSAILNILPESMKENLLLAQAAIKAARDN